MGHLDSLFFLNVSSPGWADTDGRFSATRCRYASSEEEMLRGRPSTEVPLDIASATT